MIRLSIPAQLVYRELALSAVLTAITAERPGADDSFRDEVVSALNEALNNIVLHAYRGVRGGRIDLTVEVNASDVEIQLCDRGRTFDPSAVAQYIEPKDGDVDVSSLREGGMGLFIIRACMDEVTYTRGGSGKPNVLVLRKRFAMDLSAASAEGAKVPEKEPSQSGWRMRSVAVPKPASSDRIAGSLKRK